MSNKIGQLVDTTKAANELIENAEGDLDVVVTAVENVRTRAEKYRPPLKDRKDTYGPKAEQR